MSSKNRPVQEIRIGRVKAAIWENETQNGSRYNVTLKRVYKDGDEWKTSDSFGRDDLPLLIKVLDRAHTFCYEQPAVQRQEEEIHF